MNSTQKLIDAVLNNVQWIISEGEDSHFESLEDAIKSGVTETLEGKVILPVNPSREMIEAVADERVRSINQIRRNTG